MSKSPSFEKVLEYMAKECFNRELTLDTVENIIKNNSKMTEIQIKELWREYYDNNSIRKY